MTNAYQAMRAMEREQNLLDEAFTNGELTPDAYRDACRELQRDLQAAYEEDLANAARAVREDWGDG